MVIFEVKKHPQKPCLFKVIVSAVAFYELLIFLNELENNRLFSHLSECDLCPIHYVRG